MNSDDNRKLVTGSLQSVANYCRKFQGLVLTESDLKCQVYCELISSKVFGEPKKTLNAGIYSIPVHTETKFFDTSGLLTQAPDLVITDVDRLSILNSTDGSPLPSKEFHFDGSSILIELKFLRRKGRANRNEIRKIEEDIQKGNLLNQRSDSDFHLFVAVFARYDSSEDLILNLFERYKDQPNLTCLYFGGMITE